MAHAWKACWVQALGGSNPPSSASRANGRAHVTAAGTPKGSRRKAVRRHRRERQVLVFGLLTIGIVAVTFIAMGMYKDTIAGPFNASFVTPQADFTSSITVPCPPAGTPPLETSAVAVRVLNGTNKPGIAGNTLE